MPFVAPPLAAALADLMARSERTREVDLDAVADALGMHVSVEDVERVLVALEGAGRRIVIAREARPPPEVLRSVLVAARSLTSELGRTPSIDELALRTNETVRGVRRALLYARALGR